MRRLIFLLSLISLFILGSINLSIAADNSLTKIKDQKELRIGLCAAYPPFESRNEKTGEIEGFDVDLGKALAKQLGVQAKVIDGEWNGLLGSLNRGDVNVLITCMSKSETKGQNVNFSDIYYLMKDVIITKADNQSINTEADLKNKAVGVQIGSAAEQSVDKIKDIKEIRRFNYNPEAFLDLKHGRIDAVVVGYAYAINQTKAEPGQYKVAEPIGEESEIVMVLPKNADELTAALNTALKEIKDSGEYDKFIRNWLTPPATAN